MLLDGIVIGIVLKEVAVLIPLCIEGLILVAIGFILKTKHKKIIVELEPDRPKEKDNQPVSKVEDERKYVLGDIFTEESLNELHNTLVTHAGMYNNFYPGTPIAEELSQKASLFANKENALTKEEWLSTAEFFHRTTAIAVLDGKSDVYVDMGAKCIEEYFAHEMEKSK